MDEETLKAVVHSLPFVKNHSIEIISATEGTCKARMPLDEKFKTPPANFPAAMVGMLGDIAGITACISILNANQVCSTMDFTIKMTGIADGDYLEAEGEALSVGKTVATGRSNIFSVKDKDRTLCATVLVTGRVLG